MIFLIEGLQGLIAVVNKISNQGHPFVCGHARKAQDSLPALMNFISGIHADAIPSCTLGGVHRLVSSLEERIKRIVVLIV